MNILRKAWKLEEGIARALDGVARSATRPASAEPLEIVHAVCDAVATEVQPAGRGRRVFPFNRIKVSLVAPSKEARARLSAVFDSEPSLSARIADRLRSAGCEPLDLVVRTVYVPSEQPGWSNAQWHVEYARASSTGVIESTCEPGQPVIELTIVHGAAETPSSSFAQARVDLGRCTEVRDERNRLIRTNHIAFADAAGPINHSVSRRHAHIEFTADSGAYRVHDDRSGHGTGVLRDGKVIPVPAGARGIRLRSGDEIVLGEARVLVRIAAHPTS